MRFDIVTLFPDIFSGYLGQSLLNKAIQAGLVGIEIHDLRAWTTDKHRSVDDRPFGGGPGMVLMAPPVVESVESIRKDNSGTTVLLTPQGNKLTQKLVEDFSNQDGLILLCGRYEGFDQRVIDILQPMELSIGDFVLNGGEVAAMVVVDTVIRKIPGVLGDERSSRDDSFSENNRWLEGAQYTRPREYRGHTVPEVLLSGNHQEIARWRREQSYQKTKELRLDLLSELKYESKNSTCELQNNTEEPKDP